MLKILAAAAAVVLLTAPASAGSTTLEKGNAKMALYCNGSGCYTAPYVNGKKGKAKRIGPAAAAITRSIRSHSSRRAGPEPTASLSHFTGIASCNHLRLMPSE